MKSIRALPFQWIVFSIVILAVIGYYAVTEWAVPLPFYDLRFDPEMPYFANSLALFKGVPYSYIDHPGTPVEVLGSVLLAMTKLYTRAREIPFFDFHIAHPHVFLAGAHGLLALASVATVFLMTIWSVRAQGRRHLVGGLAVAVSFYAVYPSLAFHTLKYWSHNSFAFPLGTTLLLLLVIRLRQSDSVPIGTAFAGGVLAGLLASVQLYFAVWVVGVAMAFMLNSWFRGEGWGVGIQRGLVSGAGAAAGFFIGFEPVLHRYRDFGLWVLRLIEHQGRYGRGSVGITSMDQMIRNAGRLWDSGGIVFIGAAFIVALTLVAMRARRWKVREDPGWWSGCLALLLQLILLWGLIIKHPGELYLLGVAGMLPVLLALALTGLLSSTGRIVAVGRTAAVIFLLGFAAGMWMALQSHFRSVAQVRYSEEVISREIEAYGRRIGLQRGEMTILWGYGIPSRCYALRFGNSYAGRSLQGEIDSVCPNEWEYIIWTDDVQIGSKLQPLQDNNDWDILLVPEAFVPPAYDNIGEIKVTSAETEGYGRIVVVTSRRH
jgi:hypothetical protein